MQFARPTFQISPGFFLPWSAFLSTPGSPFLTRQKWAKERPRGKPPGPVLLRQAAPPSRSFGLAVPLRRKRLAASATGGASAFAQPKPVGAQYRTHSLRRRMRTVQTTAKDSNQEMKRLQPVVRSGGTAAAKGIGPASSRSAPASPFSVGLTGMAALPP